MKKVWGWRAPEKREKIIMEISERARGHMAEGLTFLKWVLYACVIGVLVGLVAVAFSYD